MSIPEAPPPGLLAKASVRLGSCVGCTQAELFTKGPLAPHVMQHVIVAGARLRAICLAYSKASCHAQPHVMLCMYLQASAIVLGLMMTAKGKRH